jgi:drug/metabolite transporter (DMT)-like permease
MNHTKPALKDYLLLHLLIIFWGFTSILGVFSSLEAPFLVVYRTGLSFVTLAAILYFRKEKFKISFTKWPLILLAGVFTAFHWTTFFASAQISNVSTCLAGMSTTALWTSLLEPIFTKRKFQWTELILAALVSFGLIIIYQSDFSMALGLSISLASAIACSCFTIFNRSLVQYHSPSYLTTIEMGIAFVFSLAILPLLSGFGLTKASGIPIPQNWDWLNILFLSWVCTVFAYTMSIELMKKFTAFAMNLTVNLEPVYGIIMGILIFGQKEKMAPEYYLGLLLIFAGVFVYPIIEKAKNKKEKPV